MVGIFFIHGSYGHPSENWFPWLKKELEKLGHKCYIPAFPTPENQELGNWLEIFKSYIPKLNSSTVLVGHSTGATFLLRLLERIDKKVKSVFLVAGPVKPLNNQFDKVNMSFVNPAFDWKKIKSNAKHFYPVYSENDPYVSPEHGKIISENLGAELILLKDAGHFNAKVGYIKFEFLLNLIKKEL